MTRCTRGCCVPPTGGTQHPLVYSRSSELLTSRVHMNSCWHALRRTHRRDACTCATNVFSTFLLPGQPCMSWLDMHPQVQRAKFCNKFSRFSPSSAFGRASIALRRPAKAKPVSCWPKLAANVSSRCFQRCWFACGKDNTNASYSGMTALHPGPRRCAPRAGIRRSCPHTRVVLSTYRSLR